MTTASNEAIFFLEKDEFMAMLEELVASDSVDRMRELVEKMCSIVNDYQEQPHLLDPFLTSIVNPIMMRVRTTLRAWHLERMTEIQAALKENDNTSSTFVHQVYHNPQLHVMLTLIYQLCKTRGFKDIIKLFPHEVADLEPCVKALLCQDSNVHETWETRYVLLLWLSILVLIPFDLSSVDSSIMMDGVGQRKAGITTVIIDLCKSYLADPGATRNAAAFCLARLLSRPDMDESYLRTYLQWATLVISQCSSSKVYNNQFSDSIANSSQYDNSTNEGVVGESSVSDDESDSEDAESASLLAHPALLNEGSRIFLCTGVLSSMVEISKLGHRESLTGVLADAYARVSEIFNSSDENIASRQSRKGLRSSPLLRKLMIKFASRTGLSYLPPVIAPWRYSRGSRSLLDNLLKSGVSVESESKHLEVESVPSVEIDPDLIPPEIEQIIDSLLQGLRDPDTVVRWSSAKGIGRLTGRLPKIFGDDVIFAVTELLSRHEPDAAWHGGCLALAELARRGLFLPERLAEVVPLVVQALQYDQRRGTNSVGQHVRDAACYVCWSFARAYEPSVLRPFMAPLSQAMMVTAVYDREVNCRRAAAASFQEAVGRQGLENVPNGADVLTAADYYSLGNRAHAYLRVGPMVAQFPQYTSAFLEHLLGAKLKHWDPEIRALAAGALAALASLDPRFAVEIAVPELLQNALSPDLAVRHGATLALAELTIALCTTVRNSTLLDTPNSNSPTNSTYTGYLSQTQLDEIRNLLIKAEKARVYTGRGGESVRAAMCRLLEAQAVSNVPLGPKALLRFLQTLDDCLRHPHDSIQASAVQALQELSRRFPLHLAALPGRADVASLREPAEKTCVAFAVRCNDANPTVRRGFCLALGALPAGLFTPVNLEKSVDALIVATRPEKQAYKRDAETRRNACIALGELVWRVGVGRSKLFTTSGGVLEILSGLPPSCSCVEDACQCPSPVVSREEFGVVGLDAPLLGRILQALLEATRDYATDNRGDVGSWVRKAAMEALEKVLLASQLASWRHDELLRVVRLYNSSVVVEGGTVEVDYGDLNESLAILLQNTAPTAFGGPLAELQRLQHSSGYGIINGYVAGTALLASSRDASAALEGSVTPLGLQLGRSVRLSPTAAAASRVAASTFDIVKQQVLDALGGAAATESASWSSIGVLVDVRGGAIATVLYPTSGNFVNIPLAFLVPSSPPVVHGRDEGILALDSRLAGGQVAVPLESPSSFLSSTIVKDILRALLIQGAEKLDLLRAVAGDALSRLLHLPYELALDGPLSSSTGRGVNLDLPALRSVFISPAFLLLLERTADAARAPATGALLHHCRKHGLGKEAAEASSSVPTYYSIRSKLDEALGITSEVAKTDAYGPEDLFVNTAGVALIAQVLPPLHPWQYSVRFSGVSARCADSFAYSEREVGENGGRVTGILDLSSKDVEKESDQEGMDDNVTEEDERKPVDDLNKDAGEMVQWAIPHQCFPLIVKLLGNPTYSSAVLEGLVTSVGGLSESVVRFSTQSLVQWASHHRTILKSDALESEKAASKEALQLVVGTLLKLLQPRPRLQWEKALVADGEPGDAVTSSSTGGAAGFDPSLQRWFQDILGASSGAGFAGAAIAQRKATAKEKEKVPNSVDKTHRIDVRIIVPTMKTLELLLNSGALFFLEDRPLEVLPLSESSSSKAIKTWSETIISLVKRRVLVSREDVGRVMAACSVFLAIAGFDRGSRADALIMVLDLLGHPYPHVRKFTAERLHIKLLTSPQLISPSLSVGGVGTEQSTESERYDQVMEILLSAPWDARLDEVLPHRDRLYPLFCVDMPELRMGMSEADKALAEGVFGGSSGAGNDDYSSYGALAREAGY